MTHALKRLAEKYGATLTDADLAALPDAPKYAPKCGPQHLRHYVSTPRRTQSHRSGNDGRRDAGGVGMAHSHSGDAHSRHRRPVGARNPEKLARRRRWAASGWLPPALACRFTCGEIAALSVIAQENMRSGECCLPIAVIAARAGVSRTTVQNAVRECSRLGIASSRERRHRGRKSETNIVRIVSKEWTAWLAKRRQAIGSRNASPISKEHTKEGQREESFGQILGYAVPSSPLPMTGLVPDSGTTGE